MENIKTNISGQTGFVRQSNFELLRILCMLMLTAGHLIYYFGSAVETTGFEANIGHLIKSFTIVSVNCFILISGYFGIRSRTSKVLKLCFMVWFYSIAGFVIGLFAGTAVISKAYIIDDLRYIFPITVRTWWFITMYLALTLLSPWLNKFTEFLSQKSFTMLLIALFAMFCLLPTVCKLLSARSMTDDNGYGIVNFIFLYFVGRYIRKYDVFHSGKLRYLLLYCASSAVLFFADMILSKVYGAGKVYFLSYDTVFCFVGSVMLFLFFKNIRFTSKAVNYIGKNVLSVYLIYMHPALTGLIFYKIFDIYRFRGALFVAECFVVPVIIFVFCRLIELLRSAVFGKFEKIMSEEAEATVSNLLKRF
ncbi:MAG: acyltransferase [Clostridiales bacterium]|nr:acyltransferase [Clostridiales bacterium]